jgi:CheY-like chemotaxis protein
VGDSDDAFLRHIARVLLQGGFTVYLAHDGAVVMELIRAKAPQVAIVDVALPKIFGFEIAEMVKNDPALKTKTRVVLLGSVYEKDRFRRQPQSLYGADEYIEKHHDGKAVLAKVRRLILGEPEPPLETEAPAEAPPPAPAAPAPPSPPRPPVPPAAPAAAKPPTAPPKPAPPPPAKAAAPVPAAPKAPPAATAPPTPDDPANQKAARLARTIVSDVALYNPDLVTRGVKEGNIYNLLAKDISDGLKHYNSRVSEEIRSQRDYFKEAMEALIAKKRAELGLG